MTIDGERIQNAERARPIDHPHDHGTRTARASWVDVVVISYNSLARLRDCITPLAREEGICVIVVDNASRDGSLESVADLPIVQLPLDRNVGFGGGCNVGWQHGSAPYVLFLNPDALLSPDGLRRLATVLEEADAGIVAPRIRREDDSLDWSLRRFPEVRSILGQALFAHRLFPRARWVDEVIRVREEYEHPHTCEWASGACLLVRRELLEELGGFDDGFFMYCEDIDLCRRAWEIGARVYYTPEVTCIHAGGASAPRTGLVPVLARSRVRYAKKHFPRRRALAYRIGVGLTALTHVVLSKSMRSRIGYARALAPILRG